MLKVYNTLEKDKVEFKPLNPPFVGIYVCGPTVYDDPHLGHAKSYVSFDVIVRYLRTLGYKVRYVQNITDVGHLQSDADTGEDKVLKKARLEKLEPVEIAQKYERHFFRDMDRLNCLRPDISCRATGHIPEMIELVEKLLEKGFAYESEGNVYFDVSKFERYGDLSRRKVNELLEGTRIEAVQDKRHPADFALWKKADAGHLMQWRSPWGMGFPGWHLECSVMSMKYLGDSIDIHGGGLDNQFPHHECEIAQSESVTDQQFAKYWLHNNMVTVDGQKMSKSLNNFVTLEELFKKFDPMTVRFFVLQGHYRSPQDFSDEALEAAQKGLAKLKFVICELRNRFSVEQSKTNIKIDVEPWKMYQKKFYQFMNDDFNTAGAISVLFDIVRNISNQNTHNTKKELKNIEDERDELIFNTWGPNSLEYLISAYYLLSHFGEDILGLKFEEEKSGDLQKQLVEYLIELRKKYREDKDWTMADEIRDNLAKMGVVIEDGKERTTWKKI